MRKRFCAFSDGGTPTSFCGFPKVALERAAMVSKAGREDDKADMVWQIGEKKFFEYFEPAFADIIVYLFGGNDGQAPQPAH